MKNDIKGGYVCVQSWMVTELGLKGNDLLVYAIIYGFCVDGVSRFTGSRQYIANWVNSTVRGVQKNLNSLMEKGFLGKEEKVTKNGKKCEYFPINLPWEKEENQEQEKSEVGDEVPFAAGNKVPGGGEQSSPGVVNKVPGGREQSSPGVVNKVPRGSEQSSPNNIDYNIDYSIYNTSSSSETESSKKKRADVEEVVSAWNQLEAFGIKAVSKIDMASERGKRLKARIDDYGLDSVLNAIQNIKKSAFLQGRNRTDRKWRITFDWFVRPNNFPKVLEGNYEDEEVQDTNEQNTSVESWDDYEKKHGYNPKDFYGDYLPDLHGKRMEDKH